MLQQCQILFRICDGLSHPVRRLEEIADCVCRPGQECFALPLEGMKIFPHTGNEEIPS
jgi:hypothetical protein